MAQLLGTKYCIDSLLKDVEDIQETVAEVSSRVGQITYQSWKFPDKMSIDVNVKELIQDYQYDESDPEQNELTHVLLYDLLIDRLLFLLQCFTHFNEVLLHSKSDNLSSNEKSTIKSISAGFTAKKCWSRLSQVAIALQQLGRAMQKSKQSENLTSKSMQSLRQSSVILDNRSPAQSFIGDRKSIKSPISSDVLNRSCQTDETTYVSCEICSKTQSCLFDVGKSVAKVCKSQGLPTSLEDYMSKQTDGNNLSLAELTRWSNLQMKDLSRIDRQMESLTKQINPLKRELIEAAKKEQSYKRELDQADVILERKLNELKTQQNVQLHKCKQIEKELQDHVTSLNRENSKLKENKSLLQDQVAEMKDELLEKHRSLRVAENEKSMLKEEALEGRQYEKDALRLQGEVGELCRKLQSHEEKLRSTNSLLEKEQNRNRTMLSHEEALQVKQQSLLHRFEAISEECEELRERVSAAEEERDEIEEELGREREKWNKENKERSNQKNSVVVMKEDKNLMREKVEKLEFHVQELERDILERNDRERLLVSYPDLHKSQNIQVIENSGDVFTDMKRQIEANHIRIRVLEEENESLMKTLSKLSPSRPLENDIRAPSVQLWKSSADTSTIDLKFIGLDDERPSHRQVKSSSPKKNPLSSRNKPWKSPDDRKAKDRQVSPSRHSFSVGPGKRPTSTPVSSRPSSGRSALLKPWT